MQKYEIIIYWSDDDQVFVAEAPASIRQSGVPKSEFES